MKQALIAKLEAELELFASQPESLEYKDVAEVLEAVKAVDVSKLEAKAEKFTVNGAVAWLNLWAKNGKRRIYLNVRYKNGYRPNFNDGFIEF